MAPEHAGRSRRALAGRGLIGKRPAAPVGGDGEVDLLRVGQVERGHDRDEVRLGLAGADAGIAGAFLALVSFAFG